MNNFHPLVPRIPGSKQVHLKLWAPILCAHSYKICYEPYAGGLTVSNYLLQLEYPTLETIVCAEIDPSLISLYSAWQSKKLREQLQSKILNWQEFPVNEVLNHLKSTYEQAWIDDNPSIDAAVAGLLLRYVSYNGKLAPNASSERLNIDFSDQQLAKWGKFEYKFPPAPETIHTYENQQHIDWHLYSDIQPSIAIIDPPYAGTTGKVRYRDPDFIRPVYFHHEPHSRETLNMAFFPVEEALSNGVTVAIACNYYNDKLNEDYEAVAHDYGYEVFNFDGIQPKLNNGRSTKKAPYYKDCYWVFCKSDNPLIITLSHPPRG